MESEQSNLKTANYIIEYLFLVPQLVGFIFNIPAFVVFSRKKFKNTIFSTYFRYLCISDTITLLFRFEYIFNLKVFEFRIISIFSCKIINYFVYFISSLSVWILVVISIDRFLSISYPASFIFRKLKQNQILVLFAIIIYHMIYWLSVPFLAHISIKNNGTNETISYHCHYGTLIVDVMDFLDSSFLPFFLMFISTSLTLRTIFKSRSKSQSNQQDEQSKIKTKDIKFAINSILLNLFFLVFNFPLTLYFFSQNFVKFDIELKNLIHSISELLYYVNYANIFFISYFFNSIFYKEFFDLINELKLKF